MKRYPAVAGMFYEADPSRLVSQIEWCFTHPLGPGKLPSKEHGTERTSIGFVVPHAGYMYSGPIAAHAYYHLSKEKAPDTFVILGPNHTGLGTPVSVMVKGSWVTPLGEAVIDEELAFHIVREASTADMDDRAHTFEHSIEVQLPFLQYVFGEVKFVPIVIMLQTIEVARDLAEGILQAADRLGRDVVILASSDMTHYEPYERAKKKDALAIRMIEAVDPEGLFKVIEENDITMCGPGPVMTLLYVARLLGAKRAELLAYATSGDVTGDKSAVVGYASIRVPKQ